MQSQHARPFIHLAPLLSARNEPVSRVLPSLYEEHRDAYRGKGLRDLCDEMFAFKVNHKQVRRGEGE